MNIKQRLYVLVGAGLLGMGSTNIALFMGTGELQRILSALHTQNESAVSLAHLGIATTAMTLNAMDAIINAGETGEESKAQLRKNGEDLTQAMLDVEQSMAGVAGRENPENVKKKIQEMQAAYAVLKQHLTGFVGEIKAGNTAALAGYDDAIDEASEKFREQVEAVGTLNSAGAEGILDRFSAQIFKINSIALALFGIVLVLQAGFSYITVSNLSGRIRVLLSSIRKLQEGETDFSVQKALGKDEIGTLARALDEFKITVSQADEMKAAQAREQQQKEEKQQKVNARIHTSEAAIKESMGGFGKAGEALSRAAQDLAKLASGSREGAASIGSAATQTSHNVQTVSAATEELTASIREISGQIARASGLISDAVVQAQAADGTVQKLSQAAGRIGEIIDIIRNIAEQINLLALNATIESARAGEAGKGFAVVAGEVKNLAGQTSRATDDIAKQIADMQQIASEVVQVLGNIGGAIGEVNQVSTAIASAVEEQSAATQDIARNVQVAAQGVDDVTRGIGGVANAATQVDGSAGSVLSSVSMLNSQSEKLKSEMDAFLADIRAA